jgi:hypothetical protein
MSITSWVRQAWSEEPVIIGAVVPQLVAFGAITSQEANLIRSTATVVVAVVAQASAILGAVRARAIVKSPATQAREAAAVKP